ncbi:MAG: trehalase family glycosidase [Methylacidiphilales bacterium]|nr:trehalase family glycosidase [Candidatus Methylacidiphilales bacterium]
MTSESIDSTQVNSVIDYIRANWPRSIYRDSNGSGYNGEDLPFPYSSPCIKGEGHYSYFFYWDTYFTNLGLLRHGYIETARDNIRNMLWLIQRQGYMPNHVALYNRSQSPYFCRIVQDYFAAGGNDALLPECANGIRQEYNFWTTARNTPIGLTQHRHHETADGCAEFYDSITNRLHFLAKDASTSDKVRIGGHYMAEAEATCDFTPRFSRRCLDFCQVDLNALLFEYELVLADYSQRLGWGDHKLWLGRNAARRERMNRYLWNEEQGLFLDYDFINQRPSDVPAQTGYQTLFCGLATPQQAARMVANLPLFERDHGMAYTPEMPGCRDYQWAFPNVWPPMVWMMVEGLRRYGYEPEALRLARKYVATTIRLFEKTGQLWEKTDAATGEVAGGEYTAAPMLGWTAGVFVALIDYIRQK